LNSHLLFDAIEEDGGRDASWEDGQFVLYRAWRRAADGTREAVLVVMPAAEHPTPATFDHLAHEYGLREELDGEWAVRPLELRRERGRTVLVLADPGGEPLDRLLATPMEVESFLRLAIGIAAALGKLHRSGLVHKDLKPAHILANCSDGQVRLTGFGLASRLPRERQAPAPPEVIAGTLAYMAPEQTGRMNRSIDSRSDLYALGVTLYEMSTGNLPFAASDPMEWVHCHIARRPVPPAERLKEVPGIVSAIIMKLLAKAAEDRYQTAAGLERDLRRCLAQWETKRHIDDFPLGERDTPDRLLIPEKLYGRAPEIDALIASFDRVVASGTPELVLVSGYSGIGKSSVVNELHKVLVPPRGLFASGKFDQYKRDIPYSTLAQAFQGLVRQILDKQEQEVARWRGPIQEALGANGQLVVTLIPELELIIGPQPPVPALPAQDAQNRFQMVFRHFLGVFARKEHPLAVFLDDLQWLDTATLQLLEHLVTHPETRYVLLIGAYRDNEVGPSHPLMLTLDAICKTQALVREIVLSPLRPDDLGQLVADALLCPPGRTEPLAQLVYEKTAGNPFFAIQFIEALAEERLLAFDERAALWQWDVARVQAKGFTDNVVDLMVDKLNRLPYATQEALKQLACLGNRAAIATMTLVHGGAADAMHAALWEAVRVGLVLRAEGAYTFLHDRVHEAAYSLIPEERRSEVHLRIGRLLLGRLAARETADAIFEIVNHLNRGAALITDDEERQRVVTFNLMAGRRAKGSTAYASARNYLAQAIALLSPDAWTRHYEETFELYLLFSECEYLVGNFAAADALFEMILERAQCALDRVKVQSLRIKLYQVAGKYDEGLAVAREALRHFGVTFPDADHDISLAIAAQFRDISINMQGRHIGALLDAPLADDPAMRAIIDLLVDTAPCAYIARPALFPLVTLEAVNRSMLHGNTDQSSYAYAVYAIMLVSVVGDIPSAFQFSEMSLRLNEKFNNRRLRGTLLHLHGDHINFWRRHIATGLPILEQAFTACLEVGDLVYAGFLAFETVWQVIEKGDALEDVLALSAKYAAFAQQSHNEAVYETIRLEQRFVAGLQGRAADPLNFDDDTFNEAASLATIVKAAFGCGVVFHHIMKQMLAVLYGRYREAMDFAAQAEPVLGAAMAMPIEATYYFYHALTLAALFPTASAVEQERYRQLLDEILKRLTLWASNCPENYGNRQTLIAAEIARLDDRELEAERLYEEAIRLARENGFVHNEGIANELAARFYAARGFATIAYAYLRNARYCYLRWGAVGKVRQLHELYPDLGEDEPAPDPQRTIGAPIEHLELATVLKVLQAVSGEIVLEKLIDTLLRTAVEHAGAERGLLILPQGDELWVQAEATTSGSAVTVDFRDAPISGAELSEPIVRYAARTQESVLLDDASAQGSFSNDAYIRRKHARSVLCLPLMKQGKPVALLYLENNLAPRAFTPGRIAVLKLLASEATTSLENSRLYRELQEREAKIRRLVDANLIGIFIWDLEGRIIEANDAFLRIVGYDREDLASGRLHWTELTPAEWRERDRQGLAELRMTGTAQPFEKEYFRKGGSRVPVLIGAATFSGSGNQGAAFVLDLTERKRAEAEARDSERRYRELQLELAHANRVATMGQLSASIAHEINQPIAAAIINANAGLRWLGARPPDLEEVRLALARVVRDGNHAGEVIGRIRALIKKAPPRRERLDINEAAREVIALTQADIQRHGVGLQSRLSDGLPLVSGDRVQLQQVMVNLVVNAVEAMSGVGNRPRALTIVSGAGDANDIFVEVQDTGPGLDPTHLDRLFQSFYTTKPEGMGVGLAISRSIVEAHDGRLSAAPNEPHGAVFRFTLPVEQPSREGT
jgi:PAS domain S-box-containing protein